MSEAIKFVFVYFLGMLQTDVQFPEYAPDFVAYGFRDLTKIFNSLEGVFLGRFYSRVCRDAPVPASGKASNGKALL